MNRFARVLSEILSGAEERIPSAEQERETILAARAGDEDATLALFYAYAPSIRDTVARFRYAAAPVVWGGPYLGPENGPGHDGELESWLSVVTLGMVEAIAAWDPEQHDRLAGIVAPYLTHAAAEAMASYHGVSVPTRTSNRFFQIVRAAGGDLEAAEALAPKYLMSRETFRAASAAVMTTSIERESGDPDGAARVDSHASLVGAEPGDAYAAALSRLEAEAAFLAPGLSADQRDVLRFAYGFATGEPMTDAEVVYALSARELGVERAEAGESVVSRATVQRLRVSGLAVMRDALGEES